MTSKRSRNGKTMKANLQLLSLLLLCGCATRSTILVDTQRDMVLIVAPVKAKVAVWQGGKWVENGTMILPAGWICGPERKP
jgi:uncharacterized lipoprotein YajG